MEPVTYNNNIAAPVLFLDDPDKTLCSLLSGHEGHWSIVLRHHTDIRLYKAGMGDAQPYTIPPSLSVSRIERETADEPVQMSSLAHINALVGNPSSEMDSRWHPPPVLVGPQQ